MFLVHAILLHLLFSTIQCDQKGVFLSAIRRKCRSIPKLNLNEIVPKETLGEGGGGKIYRVEYGSTTLALKRIKLYTRQDALRAAEEVCTLYKMKNAPHILKVQGTKVGYQPENGGWGVPHALYTMDEYNGDLLAAMEKYPNVSSPAVLYQLALAVKETHDNKRLHLDIKPANFLVRHPSATNPGLQVALSDFGSSQKPNRKQVVMGTYEYMAPEIFKPYRDLIQKQWGNAINARQKYLQGDQTVKAKLLNTKKKNFKKVHPTVSSDVYSLGISFHYLATKKYPSNLVHDGGDQVLRILFVYDYTSPQCGKIDSGLCKLITWMMKENPKERPSMQQVLDHEFFKSQVGQGKQ